MKKCKSYLYTHTSCSDISFNYLPRFVSIIMQMSHHKIFSGMNTLLPHARNYGWTAKNSPDSSATLPRISPLLLPNPQPLQFLELQDGLTLKPNKCVCTQILQVLAVKCKAETTPIHLLLHISHLHANLHNRSLQIAGVLYFFDMMSILKCH